MEPVHLDFAFCRQKLAENPIFKDLDDNSLDSLLSCFSYKKWKKNTEFFHGDQTFYKCYIILNGRLKMYQIDPNNGREFTVFILSKNDVFDVISLLDGEKHSMNFETLDDVEVLSAPIEKMRQWIAEHPEINKTLLPYLGRRMRMLETKLTDNILSDIPTRLAKLILTNIDESSQQLQLINDLPHDEIAKMIGTTRAVVNRHIQSFKNSGMIVTERKRTRILNLKLLMERVALRY